MPEEHKKPESWHYSIWNTMSPGMLGKLGLLNAETTTRPSSDSEQADTDEIAG